MRRYCRICGQEFQTKGTSRKFCSPECVAIKKAQYDATNKANYPSQTKEGRRRNHELYYAANREKILARKRADAANPLKKAKLKEYQARTRAKQRAAVVACRELGLI